MPRLDDRDAVEKFFRHVAEYQESDVVEAVQVIIQAMQENPEIEGFVGGDVTSCAISTAREDELERGYRLETTPLRSVLIHAPSEP